MWLLIYYVLITYCYEFSEYELGGVITQIYAFMVM